MASPPPPRTGNAGRYLFLFLVGLVTGAVCAVMALLTVDPAGKSCAS